LYVHNCVMLLDRLERSLLSFTFAYIAILGQCDFFLGVLVLLENRREVVSSHRSGFTEKLSNIATSTYKLTCQIQLLTLSSQSESYRAPNFYAWGAQLQLGSSTNYQQTGNGADPFSVTGNLTWNSNGTLQQLSIFDLFDTANNQTCKYGYDDLARISSANCGTAANQSFAYDAFGNIQKTGSPNAFTPTYASNNRINAISGCSPAFNPATAYDADGNLLYDCTNTYTYDAYGKVASINTIPITYDALGRMVENGSGEILYSPIGKLALMTRQITQNIFLPLPGGEQATYTGSTLRFRHSDWLGSSRFESNTADKEYADLAYAPFGETYSVKSNVTTPYISFTGQQPDTVAGLYDFTYREYSPGQGRWISPDPAGLQAVDFGNPQSFNRYAYVLNQPTGLVDAFGLCPSGQADAGRNGWDAASGQDACGGIAVNAPFPGWVNGIGWVDGLDGWSTWDGIIMGGSRQSNGIFEGENSTGWSLGPSPSDILQQILSGNFSSLGVPTLNDLMNQAWVMDAEPANNGTPTPKNPCVADALKAGATNVGIDLLGFLPEAGGVARVVGHQAGYVGKVADNLGKNMLTADTKTTGTLASAIGFSSSDWTTWVSAGITAADFVPVLSDFTTPVAIAWDAGVAAYKVYQCPK